MKCMADDNYGIDAGVTTVGTVKTVGCWNYKVPA